MDEKGREFISFLLVLRFFASESGIGICIKRNKEGMRNEQD
jgi:hypothetical protein